MSGLRGSPIQVQVSHMSYSIICTFDCWSTKESLTF
ncbi:hypothetical protein EJ110_NYTH17953 [Nymphaea thermarum]|nr:hypothetical protein EJ110_NYTH17953 [Nymphaea thermarum]